MKNKVVFYIASRGGHLTELLTIKPDLSQYNIKEIFISNSNDSSIKNLIVVDEYLLKQPIKIIICFAKAFYFTLKYKPTILVTTGAQMAFPFVVFSKIMLRTKIIFIECSAQVENKSITGKFCYLFSDKFYVQWPTLLKVYGKKAEFKGGFLCSL